MPTWVPENYTDPTVKEFVHQLRNIVSENSDRFYCDEGIAALMVKDRTTRKKIIEYWPGKNMIIRTVADHQSLGIPAIVTNEYHDMISRKGNPVKEPEVFIDLLKKVIVSLS